MRDEHMHACYNAHISQRQYPALVRIVVGAAVAAIAITNQRGASLNSNTQEWWSGGGLLVRLHIRVHWAYT